MSNFEDQSPPKSHFDHVENGGTPSYFMTVGQKDESPQVVDREDYPKEETAENQAAQWEINDAQAPDSERPAMQGSPTDI